MLVAKLGLRWSLTRGITINPVIALWRSAYAPVWNHHIDRPALLWDSESGVAEETLAAVFAYRPPHQMSCAHTSTTS